MKRYSLLAVVLGFVVINHAALVQAGPAMKVKLPLEATMTVVFSPDGKQIAVGGQDTLVDGPNEGLVLLIDAENGEQQATLRHSGAVTRNLRMPNPVRGLSYSPDGKVLAVAAALGLKLWDPADGKELATLAGYGDTDQESRDDVISIAFSPDGKWLAATDNRFRGQPSRLRLWDVAQRNLVGEFEIGHNGHVAFLPNGTMLVTDKNDSPAVPWRLTEGQQLAVVRTKLSRPLVVDRQGKYVIADSMGGSKLWRIEPTDAGDLRFVDEMSFAGQDLRHVGFSIDGRLLATCVRSGVFVIYDVPSRQVVGTLLAGGPFAFSPDGTSLAVAQDSPERSPDGRLLGGTYLAVWKTDDVLAADRLAAQAREAATDMVRVLSARQADLWRVHAGGATMDMLRNVYPPRSGMWMRQDAITTLLTGPQGEAATSILIDGLKNPLVNDKQRLLHPLGLIAHRSSKARAAIIEALRTSETTDARTIAATMLALLPVNMGQEAVPALVESAGNDKSPHVRAAAERTLKELDPMAYEQFTAQARTRGPVVDRVERRDGQLRYQGRSLEEWLGRLSASYMPNEIFGQPRPDEPLAAIRAIGLDAMPVLLATLKSSEQPLRRAAAAGLGSLGSQAKAAIQPLLDIIAAADAADVSFVQGVPGGVTSEAADAVALILKEQQELPVRLVELTLSDNPAARLSAARAVAVMIPTHPRGLPVLKAAMAAADSQTMDFFPNPYAWYFGDRPNVAWLGRLIADNEAPAEYRVQAAERLEQLGPAALPAISGMLQAVRAADPNLSRKTARAIHKIGPQAVPPVRDALRATTDDSTRERLAAALWGLGDEGRSALKEELHGKEDREIESLWWAAFAGTWDAQASRMYQTAIKEALQRAGHFVPPQPPRTGPNRPPSPPMPQKASTAWSVRLLADNEAPGTLRRQAAKALSQTSQKELLPFLPVLLGGLANERDAGMVPDLAGLIQRVGPPAIPALRAAIEQAPSDDARGGLLLVLSSRFGKEGQQEYERLRQLHPEYGRLLDAYIRPHKAITPSQRPTTYLATFRVHVPESTPADDVIYITGNYPALGNWNPRGLRLQRQASGVYESQVRLAQGSRIEYKVTRGSWETVEKDQNKEELANRKLEVTSDRTVVIRVENWSDQLDQQ